MQKNQKEFAHPYRAELEQFLEEVPEKDCTRREPKPYGAIDKSEPIYVQTKHQLAELVADLKTENEISIDLEHHNYRTYLGITCLMQLSTRTKDYIIDTLALRPNMKMLLPILTDPNVLKVLHGADMDILWL